MDPKRRLLALADQLDGQIRLIRSARDVARSLDTDDAVVLDLLRDWERHLLEELQQTDRELLAN